MAQYGTRTRAASLSHSSTGCAGVALMQSALMQSRPALGSASRLLSAPACV